MAESGRMTRGGLFTHFAERFGIKACGGRRVLRRAAAVDRAGSCYGAESSCFRGSRSWWCSSVNGEWAATRRPGRGSRSRPSRWSRRGSRSSSRTWSKGRRRDAPRLHHEVAGLSCSSTAVILWIPPEIGRPDDRNHTGGVVCRGGGDGAHRSWRATRRGGEMTRSTARRGRWHAWVRSGLFVDVTGRYQTQRRGGAAWSRSVWRPAINDTSRAMDSSA